jgi:hypothetical protein
VRREERGWDLWGEIWGLRLESAESVQRVWIWDCDEKKENMGIFYAE